MWHLDCLGCVGLGRKKTPQQLAQAQLYHWNGPRKPWASSAFRELFEPYQGAGSRCRASAPRDAHISTPTAVASAANVSLSRVGFMGSFHERDTRGRRWDAP